MHSTTATAPRSHKRKPFLGSGTTLMHLLFACHGCGCSAFDNFDRMNNQPRQIAATPFFSKLPQRLLAHPNGGALAVLEHIERAWAYSFTEDKAGSQTQGFRDVHWTAASRRADEDRGAVLGSSLAPDSFFEGAQYEFAAQYVLYQGNWWVEFEGNYLGYYPNAVYGGGQKSKYAQQIQFGTETLGSSGIWPSAGSGDWPWYGWTFSAYQRNLLYYDLSGNGHPDNLTPLITSPCYSISGPFTGTGLWSVYFYDGGPGGSGC